MDATVKSSCIGESSRGYCSLGRQPARDEARGLYRMLDAGNTVEELRELIHRIEACLKFRKAVAEEFERLPAPKE